MPDALETNLPRYHHFVLLLWEERDATGMHVTWRFSLQDSQKEERIGFKSMKELSAYLNKWMEIPSEET